MNTWHEYLHITGWRDEGRVEALSKEIGERARHGMSHNCRHAEHEDVTGHASPRRLAQTPVVMYINKSPPRSSAESERNTYTHPSHTHFTPLSWI